MFEMARRTTIRGVLGALGAAVVLASGSPAAADPAAADPATEPAPAEPAATDPAVAVPAATEPEAADPAAAESAAVEPAAVEPAAAEPVATKAAAAPVTARRAAEPANGLAATARVTTNDSQATPWIGVMADLGLPDGATASIVYRPIRAMRLHAGFSHNMISLGERVGVTLVPLSWWASPTLSVEYGHYAEGNANPLVRMATGDATFSSAVLDRVGYDYANAHVGLELGRKWFTFYLHAGISRITGTVHNLSAETMAKGEGTTTVTFPSDPNVRLWTVSARLGFIVYLAK
jgi:cell wall-associated NlpC family hydrolase